MQKHEIDLMVENFFKPTTTVTSKKGKEFSLEDLVSLVSEVKSTLPSLSLLNEEAGKGNVLQYSAIPEISVSELGWSSFEDKGDVQIPSEQRAALQQYLNNIQGSDFQEKIKNINEFFVMSPEQLESSALIQADNSSSKIQKLISYLVFYKALTTIITNFNAAAAGFAFESFLAVLLNGQQVPTGQGTIADLWAGDGTPISLKLYSQASVEVGGSFTDLVNDMDKPKKPNKPFIRYIVATKDLTGKALELTGKISLYQFDIDLDNIMNIMVATSMHSRECIRIPKNFGQTTEPTETETEQPKTEQELERLAVENPDAYFQEMEKQGRLKKAQSEEQPLTEAGKKREKGDKYAAEYYTPEESVELYNRLNEEQKKIALKATLGYQKTKQFSMTKQHVFTVISGVKPSRKRGAENPDPKIGEIVIGRKNVEATINKISSLINASVFDIFSNLKILTTNINGYFATGMKDDNLADEAQTAALNIDKKTEELQKGEVGK